MATTKRKQTSTLRAIPPEIAAVLVPDLKPVSGPIMNEQQARVWVDSILDNTDTDIPEPLSRLLVFLAAYQKEPYVIDAFDALISAAYMRSRTFYDNRAKFIESQQDRVEVIEAVELAARNI